MQQAGNDGKIITKSVGFYPETTVTPLSPSSIGVLNNDEQHISDLKLEIYLKSEDFSNLIKEIEKWYSKAYDLNDQNCTDFCIQTLSKIGIILPDTQGSWPNGGGSNPADLGEDLRKMELKKGMILNPSSGVAPSNLGDCK